MPYTDEPNLNLLRTELQERWGPVNQADGFAVTVLSGTYGDISTFGVSRNDHLISCMGIAGAPNRHTWVRRHTVCRCQPGAFHRPGASSPDADVARKNAACGGGSFHLVRT
ncbi:hypothetical protein OH693_08005 [Escherichia coli]|nr:hypothetical protein [Escherichia coli]